MDKFSIVIILAVCLVSLHAAPKKMKATSSRPKYIGCQSSSECRVGNCCVIGMGRFSIPTCQSVQEIHGSCKPTDHAPFNGTVSYPDGSVVPLTDVYRMFCPCAPGLTCDWGTTTCQDPLAEDHYIYNTVIV